ncbi:MBL fold metallo-hydrolase [Marinibacterium sp. SX1]|uniref:MBL fold metallo-hydrolase n=1 Tax=Marinibacterium sp. SX1 TaxID=3388424 RepID=UPI003D16B948
MPFTPRTSDRPRHPAPFTALAPVATLAALALTADEARAQSTDGSRRPSHCIAIADAAPGLTYVHKAAWTDPLPDYTVRLHYITHASFLLQTQGGLNIVTDYTGFTGTAPLIPDVVTMNHAHSSHWTSAPDPAIPHVLEGWGVYGEGIDHHLDLGDMLIRNVSTDIRSPYGEGVEESGNSVFIFEVEGLCIGHLGHLHHIPSDAQFAAMGRLDVVMAPVDGGMTLPLPEMITTLKRLKSSVVIPMHWFSTYSLQAFLAGMQDDFAIDMSKGSSVEVSLRDLPDRPTIVVLAPEWLEDAPD